jgi:lipopolysaccharide biosynthesis glycosyltransferase
MQLVWYPFVDHQVLQFRPLSHLQISRAAYLRLAMAEMLPGTVRRVLYLDVDMVANDSLLPLWQTTFDKGRICAAVVDPGVDPQAFALKHSLPSSGQYFNSGVMLLDLDALRAEGLLQRSVQLLATPGTAYEFPDQDVLNIVLWLRWQALDPRWNFQRKFLYDDYAAWRALAPDRSSRPAIVHYTEQYKPWRADEWHPYAWLYLKNLLRTPFREEILQKGKIGWRQGIKWWLRSIIKRPSTFG